RRDIDTIMTGMPKEKVNNIKIIMGVIKRLEEEEDPPRMVRVIEEAEKQGIGRDTASSIISQLLKQGELYTPKPGTVKIVRHESE
ncbi:MAG: hypothetical protein QXL16_02455, partial [Candidatus Micrarchaeaceae archaeon]